jgi:hypothetical protein
MRSQGRQTRTEELRNAPPRATGKGRGVESGPPERYRATHPEHVRALSIGASRFGRICAAVEPGTDAIEGDRLADSPARVEAELRAAFAFLGSMP